LLLGVRSSADVCSVSRAGARQSPPETAIGRAAGGENVMFFRNHMRMSIYQSAN
jgi:hypothetical protein